MPLPNMTDASELEARLSLVRGLVATGLNQAAIVRYCMQKTEWGVTDRTIRNYHAAVMEQFSAEAGGIDRAALVVRTLDRLDYLYGKAVQLSDIRTALSITMEVVKLFHLADPQFEGDWRKAAQEAGLSPGELFERIVNAVGNEKELANAETESDG